jgi:hypothetical protein
MEIIIQINIPPLDILLTHKVDFPVYFYRSNKQQFDSTQKLVLVLTL